MTEWTQTVLKDGADFSINMSGTHVTVTTIYGSFTERVDVLQIKVSDPDLLPAVKSMFKSMLEFYNQNRKEKTNDSNCEGQM